MKRFDPTMPAVRQDPYSVYAHYRAHDPVHWGISGVAGYAGAWYLFRRTEVLAVLADPRFGLEPPAAGDDGPIDAEPADPPPVLDDKAVAFFDMSRYWLLARDPPDHTRLRALLRSSFTPASAEKLRTRSAQIAEELIDRVADWGAMDVIEDFAFPLPIHVISEMLGVPGDGRMELADVSRAVRAVDLEVSEETLRCAGSATRRAWEYLTGLIAERRRQPRDDLIGHMIRARDQGSIVSEDELLANVFFVFFAGAGLLTTTGLIANTVYCLLRHPRERARLLADPRLMRHAIDECLRYEPPVHMVSRVAQADVELNGKTIRAGDMVLAVLAAANRDPSVFAEPDRLDFARKGASHHAFGLGIHRCLGGPLARVEGEASIEVLLRRLPGLEPAGQVEWGPGVSLRVPSSLPVSF